MNKYKIEITKTYCIDILSDEIDHEKLQDMACEILDTKMLQGTEHYNQTGDTEYCVYDVTDTEDPFNAENVHTMHCDNCQHEISEHDTHCENCQHKIK